MTFLVTFHSVSSALHAQTLLAAVSAESTVVPVPRSVSSSCGYAVTAADVTAATLVETLNRGAVEWDVVYRVAREGKTERYESVAVSDDGKQYDG